MIVKTLFQHEGRFALGEVEVKLLPGVPLLHVVGQPDPHIKECGLKLKSALRSCDFKWPQGHQIVVNLRPSYFRKSSSGADLAIALGVLAQTGQLNETVASYLESAVVYGEIALDGKIFAPPDLPSAIRTANLPVLTGVASERIRDGEWLELAALNSCEVSPMHRKFDWESFWVAPEFSPMTFPPAAAQALMLASIAPLNVLVAGPQGSGKSTWARALYALSAKPDAAKISELEDMFGEEALATRWRPFEAPHHSITSLAMVGGGSPLFPGVISRAHGGMLLMDEFLEFNPQVLEALREPVESGYIILARKGEKAQFPANFQFVATSNLCTCGDLNPTRNESLARECKHSLFRCGSVLRKLSGPVMDRFDFVVLTTDWRKQSGRISLEEIREKIADAKAFQEKRGVCKTEAPDWFETFGYSHRRRNSLLRVARALADLRESPAIEEPDFLKASQLVVEPMEDLRRFFA